MPFRRGAAFAALPRIGNPCYEGALDSPGGVSLTPAYGFAW